MKDVGYLLAVQYWVEETRKFIKFKENMIKICTKQIEVAKRDIEEQLELITNEGSNK